MKLNQRKGKHGKSLVVALSAMLALLMIASSLGVVGEVYATEESTQPTGTTSTEPTSAESTGSTVTTSQEAVTVAAAASYTITYTSAWSGLHSNFSATHTADASGCITLEGPDYGSVLSAHGVTTNLTKHDSETFLWDTGNGADGCYYSFTGWHISDASTKLPNETVFQPGDVITPEVLEQYASGGKLTLKALWGKVYFIQNKYSNMQYEKLTRYYYNGGWNSISVIALNTNTSSGPTGAYDVKNGTDNTGFDPTKPIATIDHLYRRMEIDKVDPLDAYSTVAMLTGTLDYVKSRGTNITYTNPNEAQLSSAPAGYVAVGTRENEYVDGGGYAWRYNQSRWFGENGYTLAVTFKSSQKAGAGTKYDFYYKLYDDEGQFRGSTRFDNVKLRCKTDSGSNFLGDATGVIARGMEGTPIDGDTTGFGTENYIETTARLETPNRNPISQLRASEIERVVLKGGSFDSLTHSWGDAQSYDSLRYFYVGRNASVNNIYVGSTASDGKNVYTYPVTVVITGGKISGMVATTSISGVKGSTASGKRTVRAYGGSGHQPEINAIYAGGYGAPLAGDVDLLVSGCTNINHIRGGGRNYTSDVTGNINVRIENSTIKKDVFGGGLYGDVLDDGTGTKGKVTVNIVNSTVVDAVYGSGMGSVNTTDFNTTTPQGLDDKPSWWDTPETGFSSVNPDNGAIIQYVIHQLGRRSGAGNGANSIIWMKVTRESYLSVARVQSSNITVTNSTVGTVYGGGDLGHVVGNTNVTISDSKVGSVYGGSNGSGSLAGIHIYQPCDDTIEVDGQTVVDYLGPQPRETSPGVYKWDNTNYATRRDGTTKYEFEDLGEYTWAAGSESSIDHDKKVIYSTEMADAGVVGGNTHVTITGSSTITGAVYGGGSAGRVKGTATVDIQSGTFSNGARVYGGGNSASVTSTDVNISGGTFGNSTGAIYGGGFSGSVTNGTSVDITGGTFGGAVIYGGGRTASVASTAVTITGGNFSSTSGIICGGGDAGAVNGAVTLKIENVKTNPIQYQVFGGGNSATVGSVSLTLKNSVLRRAIYGGGNKSGATVTGNVVINATDVTHGMGYAEDDQHHPTLYGGGYSANVNGSITMNLNNGSYDWIHGGAHSGVCGDVTINMGSKASSTKDQPVINWCLRGGGDAGQCDDVVINMYCGRVRRNIHTAGNDCTVNSSTFNMYSGTVEQMFGGGDHGIVKTNSQVNLYGGTINSNVFGGGDRPTSRVGGAGVLIDDNADNTATLTISGIVYGGSDQGIVMGKETTTAKLIANGSVFNYGTGPSAQFNGRGGTKVEIKSGTLKNTVFGGCNGTAYSDTQEPSGNSNFGSIRGTGENGYSTQVLISGGTINANVYGGNRSAGQLAGGTLVKLSGGTVNGNVYGGNLGGSGTYDQGGANVLGTACVQIIGGNIGSGKGYVFGGNDAKGTVAATSVEISNLTLNPSSIYGGNNAGGTVTGQAAVTVTSADVRFPFGGNFSGGTVGSTLVTLDGATIQNAYGGNESNGTVTGKAAVVVQNNTTLTSGVYGGNYLGGTVGSTEITFTNSACEATSGGIYGGNYKGGTVTGDTNVILNAQMYARVFGGNRDSGTVKGSTFIQIDRGVKEKNSSGGNYASYVYGGNNAGGIIEGNSNVTSNMSDGHVTSLYGGNLSDGTIKGKANITMIKGSVWYRLVVGNENGGVLGTSGSATSGAELNMSGGVVDWLIGGNIYSGTIYGNVNINMTGGTLQRSYIGGNDNGGDIYGNVTMTIEEAVKVYTQHSGDTDRTYGFYGGNNQKGTIYGNTTMNINGFTNPAGKIFPRIYGGNLGGGTITGLATVNMAGGTVDLLFGGNNAGGSIGTAGNTDTGIAVNMTGGTVTTDLFGGSNASGDIAGEISITVAGESKVQNNVYGGGNLANISNAVSAMRVTIGGNAAVAKWVFGGGNQANCDLLTGLTIQDNCTITYACGGANSGYVLGTDVIVTGGAVPTLFGGSNASAGSVKGNTSVKMSGGRVTSIRGGGNYAETTGNTYVEFSGGSISAYINGAGNKSVVGGNSKVIVSGGTVHNIFGGGDSGTNEPAALYGDATVQIKPGATVTGSVFGAGNNAYATSYGDTNIQISGGSIAGSVYGGGNNGLMVLDAEKNPDGGDTFITVTGGSIAGSIYGGGNNADVPGNATITCTNLALTGALYGGGNDGALGGDAIITVNSGTVGDMFYGGGNKGDVSGNVNINVKNGQFNKMFFGGGATADVAGNVEIAIENGKFYDNVYGGGEQGVVSGSVTLDISGGEFNYKQDLQVYGGGKDGTVNSTQVSVSGITNISGSVYGGGEGQEATVFEGTSVLVDLPYEFQVQESVHYTDDISTSGRVDSVLTEIPDQDYGAIMGSVYGGGNLGQIGRGVISAGGDKATIQTAAKVKVKILHGKIGGSVFGGGRGIPGAGEQYNIRMGTVFGATDVDILGGLVMGNVYGGGEQSRVYSSGDGKTAATVDIIETATDSSNTEFEKIAINGSVFGGGDRGESDDANASVPTVYGDVYVTVQGHKDNQPSEIYFLTGGVYGDGNLCLVDGYRKITVQDFEPSTNRDMLKTFFSLQRADLAVLDNSAVVLLGAADLVEEGDSNIYSINRIDMLELKNGSTVKLDQIVKYLGGLDSDVHNEVKYIHDGKNGFTNTYDAFTTCNGSCLAPLTAEQVQNYHDNKEPHTLDSKNVLCVANGLYLEVINEKDEYGPVEGLFTLQLTYANPGEGGGFVYASIPDSTGDFICETERWSFNIRDDVTAENYQSLRDANEIFVRLPGKGFRRPSGNFSASETYYSREATGKFMDIIDDVGGVITSNGETDGYTYYYWYIGGPSVTFDVKVTGYIGAAATAFRANTTLPQHVDKYSYVLYGVSVNEALEKAVGNGGSYQLVQTASVTGQQIAVELVADGKSLGFLYYDTSRGVWAIKQGTTVMPGYAGNANPQVVANNQLIEMAVGSTNDQFTWVLHKSSDVTKTCSDLEVYLDIDLFENVATGNPAAVTTGTSALSYTANLNIVRLTATQSAFVQNGGNYNGVANNETVHITGSSKFTVEWQTKYVPAANPNEAGMYMTWGLSTRQYTYYMNGSTGEYFTWNGDRNRAENFSDGMNVQNFANEFTATANGYKRVSDNAVFTAQSSFGATAIPTGTRITMVDLSGSTPAYYYYICTAPETYIDLTEFKLMGTNTTIAAAVQSGNKPAFISTYDAQTMGMITERLVFVFDMSSAATGSTLPFTGGLTLQHLYGNAQTDVDILDYAKTEVVGNSTDYRRYYPKNVDYMFNPGANGVNGTTYTATFEADAYSDIGTAVLNVHVEEDMNWINTLFRENGFAVKVTLWDATANKPLAMPAGMYLEYRGQHYYPGPDSTYVSVPVQDFGDHEITIHNPQFSLSTATGGNTATFKVDYYSAPDANYFNSFDTGETRTDSYQIVGSDSYSLKVVSWDKLQIYAPGDEVKLGYTTAKSSGAAVKSVTVTAMVKVDGTYTALEDWADLFSTAKPRRLAEGTDKVCQWTLAENAKPGTYRLVFQYADHTECLNIIIE